MGGGGWGISLLVSDGVRRFNPPLSKDEQMNICRSFFITGIILSAGFSARAQTNVVTTTNVITVTVTNTIIVTNITVPAMSIPVVTVTTNGAVKYPWESSASAGLTLTKGNSDTLLLTTKLQTQRKMPVNEYKFDLDGTYGKTAGVKSTETLHGDAQWNHLFTERFFGYVRAEGLHDAIANVRYRFTVGPGLGYYLIKDKETTLAVEGGVSEVFEKLGNNDRTYTTLRLAERFEHKFTGHNARVWESVEYLPQIDKFQNYLVNAEVGVEAALAKNLSLQTYLDDNYNSEPAQGRKRNDVKLVSAIAYKF